MSERSRSVLLLFLRGYQHGQIGLRVSLAVYILEERRLWTAMWTKKFEQDHTMETNEQVSKEK